MSNLRDMREHKMYIMCAAVKTCGHVRLQVLDIGHNKLLNVSVKNLISSPIRLFDMTMNSQMKINEQEYKAVRCWLWWFCWLMCDFCVTLNLFILQVLLLLLSFPRLSIILLHYHQQSVIVEGIFGQWAWLHSVVHYLRLSTN